MARCPSTGRTVGAQRPPFDLAQHQRQRRGRSRRAANARKRGSIASNSGTYVAHAIATCETLASDAGVCSMAVRDGARSNSSASSGNIYAASVVANSDERAGSASAADRTSDWGHAR
jgi:hypothetical protein